jgi:hypothetical protein
MAIRNWYETHLEELGALNALEQVVLAALLLDDVAGLVGLHVVSTPAVIRSPRNEHTRTRISS